MAEAKAVASADYRRGDRFHVPWIRRAAPYLPDTSKSEAKPIDISHSHPSQLRLSCVLSRNGLPRPHRRSGFDPMRRGAKLGDSSDETLSAQVAKCEPGLGPPEEILLKQFQSESEMFWWGTARRACWSA